MASQARPNSTKRKTLEGDAYDGSPSNVKQENAGDNPLGIVEGVDSTREDKVQDHLLTVENNTLGGPLPSEGASNQSEKQPFPDAIRHPTHWLFDGSIVLHLRGTLFRLHQSTLSSQSKYFTRAFAREGWQKQIEGHVGGIPVVSVDEDPQDFAMLLNLLQDIPALRNVGPDPEFSSISSVLKVSTNLEFQFTRDWAIDRLQDFWPQDHTELNYFPHPSSTEAFGLARQYHVGQIIRGILYDLVRTLPSDLSLSADVWKTVAVLKRDLSECWYGDVGPGSDFLPPCKSPEEIRSCATDASKLASWVKCIHKTGFLTRFAEDPVIGYLILSGADFREESIDVDPTEQNGHRSLVSLLKSQEVTWCSSCLASLRAVAARKAEETWDRLERTVVMDIGSTKD